MTHSTLLKYYGIDWLAMILMSTSLLALGQKQRNGFALGGSACLCWILFGVIVGSIADIVANTICLGMNVLGFVRWSR